MLISVASNDSLHSFEPIDGIISEIITKSTWSPGIFLNNHRKIKNFKEAYCIGLDVDDGCTLDEAKEIFKPYAHVIATSRSHQKEKNGKVCDRFRVVLVFSTKITETQVFSNTWHMLNKKFPFIDAQAKDPSRMFYPCIKVVSINKLGNPVQPVITAPEEPKELVPVVNNLIIKGKLARNTLEFLALGCPVGERNTSLFKAALDMNEQGYTVDECQEKLIDQIVGPTFSLEEATNTIISAFDRDPKYPPRVEVPETIISVSDLLEESYEYLSSPGQTSGQPTGFSLLDKALGGGIREGEVTALHAEAKTGKSSFFHDIIYRMLQSGCKIGYASREMRPATEVIPNLQSIAFKKNMFKQENIDSVTKEQYTREASTWQLYFAPGYGLFEIHELRDWILALKGQMGIKHFFIDHLHFMLADPEDHKMASRLVKELKTLAQKEQISIFIIIQPNRIGEGQRLGQSSLKGGSAIGQAIDNLITMSKGENRDERILQLQFARHKLANWPYRMVVKYDRDSMRFEEWEITHDEKETTEKLNLTFRSHRA